MARWDRDFRTRVLSPGRALTPERARQGRHLLAPAMPQGGMLFGALGEAAAGALAS